MFRPVVLFTCLFLSLPSEAAKGGHPLAAPLAAAVEQPAKAHDLSLVYDTVHGLYGGDRYALSEGVLVHTHVPRRGDPPVETRATLTPAQLQALARLLEGERIWDQLEPERQPRPDESKAVLIVALGRGEATTWEWFNDLGENRRLIKVQELLASWAPAGAP